MYAILHSVVDRLHFQATGLLRVLCEVTKLGSAEQVQTCKEQLLYEIQGCYYYNCDVTAKIDLATFEQIGPDRVRLSGITGLPPPPHTKVNQFCFDLIAIYHAFLVLNV